jgi:uncharacterized RDD family membrane protein YckC
MDPSLDANGTPPDRTNRFLALLVDSVIAGLLSNLPLIGGLLGAGYFLVRDGLDLEVMNGRSLGKHLLGLRVERLDGRPMDLEASIRRNWMWGFGPVSAAVAEFPLFGAFFAVVLSLLVLAVVLYEAYLVLTKADGRRWGDELAGTRVVAA